LRRWTVTLLVNVRSEKLLIGGELVSDGGTSEVALHGVRRSSSDEAYGLKGAAVHQCEYAAGRRQKEARSPVAEKWLGAAWSLLKDDVETGPCRLNGGGAVLDRMVFGGQPVVILTSTTDDDLENEIEGAEDYRMGISHGITRLRYALDKLNQPTSITTRVVSTATDTLQHSCHPPTTETMSRLSPTGTVLTTPAHGSHRRVPTFAGNISDWQGFLDHFDVTIHRNPDLPPIEKFKYLMTYLTHNAKRADEGIRLSEQNYDLADDQVKLIMTFLQIQIEIREEGCMEPPTRASEGTPHQPNLKTQSISNNPSALALTNESVHRQVFACSLCGSAEHDVQSCQVALSTQEKRSRLTRACCCFKCGKRNHIARACRTARSLTCTTCGGHHLTIHCDVSRSPQATQGIGQSGEGSTPNSVAVINAPTNAAKQGPSVLLQTGQVWASSLYQRVFVRILLDSGSQRTFVLTIELCGRTTGTRIHLEALEVPEICTVISHPVNEELQVRLHSENMLSADIAPE
ncbi:hypothetical protein HPB47_011872, partial [Ixodes persulcatus]